MAKTNQIKKLVNGEIADADDVNQIVENAGAEGGLIPYNPSTDQRETQGGQSLGSTTYPWGSLYVYRNAALVEVDPNSPTLNASVAWKNLRRFIYLKDSPTSYVGNVGKFVRVNATEDALEFSEPVTSQFFDSSGTFLCPAGVTKVYVTMVGGGGAGGVTNAGTAGAGGGSGASSVMKFPYDVVGGTPYTVTVGAGGTGVVGGAGNNGGTSSFDSVIQAAGGIGAAVGSGSNGATALGGTNFDASASVSTTGTTGGGYTFKGGNGAKGGGNSSDSGAGGGTPFGKGANGASTGNPGTAPDPNTGAGGSGSAGGTGTAGGDGSDGFVLIQY